ncbi:MAG: zf-HC2 domain-containing protein [Armatimonadetes bacterium]|nr:zf-HC2 domain-containing protein [Armatimonadota bacterium]
MNCEHVQRKLAEYSAGLVQGDERLRLAEHLAACEPCRAQLAEYRALDELLAGERVVADEGLVRKVMTEVRVMGAPRRPVWLLSLERVAPLATVAAALPLLALFVLTALNWSSSPAADALFAGVSYAHTISLGLAVGACGLAALFAAWLTWRAAEAVS